jgi:hypothetical protein
MLADCEIEPLATSLELDSSSADHLILEFNRATVNPQVVSQISRFNGFVFDLLLPVL